MLEEIGSVDRIPEYIQRAKDKSDPFRLMGFGHRVYKNYDPRAKVMQTTCHEVLDALGTRNEPLLQVAMELERIAREDEYFVQKKLYPNIDFYSGITLRALGFPCRNVHSTVRTGPNSWLDCPMERDDRRPTTAYRSPSPALYRPNSA